MTRYSQETELQMKLFFSELSEKDQRHYAACEATKLGWGGKSYISELFQISHFRIRIGEKELNNPDLLRYLRANNVVSEVEEKKRT